MTAEGVVRKTRVLFVCVENAGRSQMAEAFARKLGGTVLEPHSAGSKPGSKLHEAVVAAMAEVGLDLGGQRPKGLSDLPPVAWDYVVTMGCGDACPCIPSKARVDWDLPDPKAKTLAEVRAVRDRIESEVLALLHRILRDRATSHIA